MRARTVATFVVAFVVVFAGFGILAADAANPAGFTAVVNPLTHIPAGGELIGTSCPAAGHCVAVGLDNGYEPISLAGDPSTWGLAQTREVTLPHTFDNNPGDGSLLLAATCTSTTSCVAVGGDGNDQPLVLRGNPATWTASQAHQITLGSSFSGDFFSELQSIACPSATACVAVGLDAGGQPLVLAGNPATWGAAQAKEITLGGTFGRNGELTSVACTSSSSCVAVGDDGNGMPIVLSGDPSTWDVPQVHEIALGASFGSEGYLSSIVCASSSSCFAVGNDRHRQPFVLSGDPATWGPAQAYQVTLGSGFGSQGRVYSLTCTSSSSCIAVGLDGNFQPLFLTGDPSTTWNALNAHEVALGSGFGSGGFLDSISCAPSACVASGSDENGQPLVLEGDPSSLNAPQAKEIALNGVKWGAFASPSSLTCLSATSCLDLGTYEDFALPGSYFMRGNPATWNQRTATPMTGVAPFSFLNGSTCPTAGDCVAVGYEIGLNAEPLVLAGSPSTWGTATPKKIALGAAFGSGGVLYSVSCSSTTSCVAVGQTNHGQPLVMKGNPATWTNANAVEIALPSTFHSHGALESVTCTSATACVAVGFDGSFQDLLWFSGNPASWNATTAKKITLTSALGTRGALFSVACTSSTNCVAVGEAGQLGARPVVVAGDPATWTVKQVFNLKVAAATASTVGGYGGPGGVGFVWSVSCEKTGYCVAVGGDGQAAPVYIAGNPKGWSTHPLVRPLKSAPSFTTAELTTSSCAPTKCFAGGFSNGGDFVAGLNGVATASAMRRAGTSAEQGVFSVRSWGGTRYPSRVNRSEGWSRFAKVGHHGSALALGAGH
jgi:hypothetical protein